MNPYRVRRSGGSASPTPNGVTHRHGSRAIRSLIAMLIAAACLVTATLTASASLTASSSARAPILGTASANVTSKPGARAKPTIVLVHGAFADASGWSAEIALLQKDGFPVIAPANPLRGLTADSDYTRSILATVQGPVVLVGHSYGGAVITNAARGAANVVALVYVGAFIPDQGTSVATSYDPAKYPGSLLTPDSLVPRPIANPADPDGQDADLYIRPDRFREIFAGDQRASTAAVMAAAQRPLSYFAFTEPSGAPAWKTLPSWDLITLDDKAISPSGQRFMATRAGATIVTVRSAHDVMVSHPRAVVKLIARVAHTVS